MKNDSPEFLFFFREYPSDSDYYYCSQWYESPFFYKGNFFATSEHFMMFYKAILFGDKEIANKIINEKSPREVKKLGGEVRGFSDPVWMDNFKKIVYVGNKEKFLQNHDILKLLLHTTGSCLVEASPFDPLYGIKLAATDKNVNNPFYWKGANALGEIITKLRDDILSGRIWSTVDLSKSEYLGAKLVVDDYLSKNKVKKTTYQVRGDLIESFKRGDVDVIIQSCNCFNRMGFGIAKKISSMYPAAELADKKTKSGDIEKLGTYSFAEISSGKFIINAYAQYGYGKIGIRADEILRGETDVKGRDSDRPHISYDCLDKILTKINDDFRGLRVGVPTIGADLGRSDWGVIKGLIRDRLTDVDVKIFYFDEVIMKRRFAMENGFGC